MQFFPSRTTFLAIGNVTIQWYAVLIVSGAFLAYYFAKRNLREYRNIDVNDFFDTLFITILWTGIIGARHLLNIVIVSLIILVFILAILLILFVSGTVVWLSMAVLSLA